MGREEAKAQSKAAQREKEDAAFSKKQAQRDKQWEVGAKDSSKEKAETEKAAAVAARKAAAAAQAASEEATLKGKSTTVKAPKNVGSSKADAKADARRRAELAMKALEAQQAGGVKKTPKKKAEAKEGGGDAPKAEGEGKGGDELSDAVQGMSVSRPANAAASDSAAPSTE